MNFVICVVRYGKDMITYVIKQLRRLELGMEVCLEMEERANVVDVNKLVVRRVDACC